MARPILRDKNLEKVTLMLDRSALEEAQKRAINNGVELSKAGNASAFVRWLVDEYKKEGDIVIEGKEYYSPKKACERFDIHINRLDSWAVKAMKGECDIPILFRNMMGAEQNGIPFRHHSPDYFLPCEEFAKWLKTEK